MMIMMMIYMLIKLYKDIQHPIHMLIKVYKDIKHPSEFKFGN